MPELVELYPHTDHPSRDWDRTCPGCLVTALDAAQAELEHLRKDAERYRWLKKADGRLLCAIAYRVPAACGLSSDDVDSVIDAAIAAPGEARYMNYTPSADPT